MSERLDIHAYVDGELSAEERKVVEDKLKECSVSQAHEVAVRHLKDAVKSHCKTPECAEAWKACRKRLDEIDRTHRVENFVGRYAWGMVAAFTLMIVGVAGLNRSAGPDLRTQDLARITAGLADVAAPISQAPEDKRRWFADVVQNKVNVQPVQLALIGGRQGKTIDGKTVTVVNLADSVGPLVLVIIEKTRRVEGMEPIAATTFYQTKINNLNAVGWMDSGAVCFLAGNRECNELCGIAEQIAKP